VLWVFPTHIKGNLYRHNTSRNRDKCPSTHTRTLRETFHRICMTYLDAYVSITLHVQICVLSDFITSGNKELLFRSHNAVFLRIQPVRFSASRDIKIFPFKDKFRLIQGPFKTGFTVLIIIINITMICIRSLYIKLRRSFFLYISNFDLVFSFYAGRRECLYFKHGVSLLQTWSVSTSNMESLYFKHGVSLLQTWSVSTSNMEWSNEMVLTFFFIIDQ
jgi:hypothetical protein